MNPSIKEVPKCTMLNVLWQSNVRSLPPCTITSPVSEAREDPKVVNYIQAGLDRANEASISRAAKIQVQLVLMVCY